MIPRDHIVRSAVDDRLRPHHLVGELLHIAEADTVSVADKPFAQWKPAADRVHGLVAAGGHDAVCLLEQFLLKRLVASVPFRDLKRRGQTGIDVVERVTEQPREQ